VESGDIVVGDRDGIVIVPLAEATNVLGRLGGIKAAEASLEAKVKAGLEVPDFIQAIMESGRVEEIS
jgi:4-hydroxy-4-methyl-2-oxoglutarate aldolase